MNEGGRKVESRGEGMKMRVTSAFEHLTTGSAPTAMATKERREPNPVNHDESNASPYPKPKNTQQTPNE